MRFVFRVLLWHHAAIRFEEASVMNKIVRDHYPVENLPADLRQGLEDRATVRVVIEVENEPTSDALALPGSARKKPLTIEETLEMIRRYREQHPERVSMDEAVSRIRELRDEWD
jgi:adenine C2-methylase RlmN of 23S rRNA A2503 and tRNA A37